MGRGQLYYIKTKRRRVNKARLVFLLVLCGFLVTVLLSMRFVNALNAVQDNSSWARSLPSPAEGEREHHLAYVVAGGANPTVVEAVIIAYNPAKQDFRAIRLPANTMVELSGHGSVRLSQAYELAGREGFVRTVADLLGLLINYFFEFNEDKFTKTVDNVGGVVLPAYMALGNSSDVLDFIYADGLSASERLERRRLLLSALAARVAESSWLQRLTTLNSIAPLLTTNMSWRKLLTTIEALRDVSFNEAAKILELPGSEQIALEGTYWKADDKQLPGLVSWLGDDISSLPRSGITVEVLNGSGIRGIAALVSSMLSAEGFTVVRSGNADRFDYPVSMVISRVSLVDGAREVAALIPGADMRKEEIPGSDIMVTVIIGQNFPKE